MNTQDNIPTSDGQTTSGDQTAPTTSSDPAASGAPTASSTPSTPTASATPDTANTIPLYATALPSPATADAPTAGGGQTGQGAGRDKSDYAPGGYGAAGGYGTAGPGAGKPYAQPYVYVPPQGAQPEQLLHKTGPSAPTIIFGALMLFAGVITLLFGLRFPNMILPQLRADPRVFVAVICAVAGVILVAIAVAWSLSKLIHNIRNRETDQTSGDAFSDTRSETQEFDSVPGLNEHDARDEDTRTGA